MSITLYTSTFHYGSIKIYFENKSYKLYTANLHSTMVLLKCAAHAYIYAEEV